MTISTFTDSGQTIENFLECIYVRCPKCNKCAQVRRIPSDEDMILADESGLYGSWNFRRSFSTRKLICPHCSYNRIRSCNARLGHSFTDLYFGLPLWLRIPCCRKVLWAYNEEHLSFLERYVAAEHRIKFSEPGRYRNNTMASRLPTWMKLAKNRQEVLKGIAKLKRLLEETQTT